MIVEKRQLDGFTLLNLEGVIKLGDQVLRTHRQISKRQWLGGLPDKLLEEFAAAAKERLTRLNHVGPGPSGQREIAMARRPVS